MGHHKLSRSALLTATALVTPALLVAAPAAAQDAPPPPAATTTKFKPIAAPKPVASPSGPLTAQSGTVQASAGMIRALMRGVDPFWSSNPIPSPTVMPTLRSLTPFWGNVTPYAGMIRALQGDLVAQAGMIRALEGPVDPYGGMIRPVEGEIDPYAGMIRPVDGDVSTQAGMIRAVEGDLASMAGLIQAHFGDLGAMAGMIRALDGTGIDQSADYATQLKHYRTFVDKSALFWGTLVTKDTGKSFQDVVAAPLLAKYGIDLNDANSLAKLDAGQREMFFLEWHDNLMQFSGADQVDHWMSAIGWTPKLTQQQGSGGRAVIGLVDFFVAKDPDIASKVIYSGGYTDFTGHGAGVASLILASHDGKGVMGIAPNARVAAYNPFDSTFTASWADVTKGITAVTKAGASVVNLSLGVPGYTLHPEWRTVFKTSAIDSVKDKTLYVIAAGNSGTVGTGSVNMEGALDSTFIVVGSVGPDGTISDFSNRPGTLCVTKGTECKITMRAGVGKTGDTFVKNDYLKESGLLMNRFLVAPGELILVADGEGGVTRVSGTSFAAPLVAGSIALLHDRWPWLKNYPRDVAKILLDTATDLGEKGADPVYGRGMLNIEAAQNVLDFDKLKYYLWNGSSKSELKVPALRTMGFQSTWATKDMYFTAFEQLQNSERDFLIPLSSRLFGTMKNGQYFQEFVYNHFVNWLATGQGFTASVRPRFGFSDLSETPLTGTPGGWATSMSGRIRVNMRGNGEAGEQTLSTAVTLRAPDGGVQFTVGSGDGALHLGGQQALRMSSDYAPYTGGANPLLGFASGGAHISTSVPLASGLALSAGVTSRRQSTADLLDGVHDWQGRLNIAGAHRYAASAYNIRLDYRPVRWLGLSGSLTRLGENRAFMGVRSLADSDFGRGVTTDGITVQADVDLDRRTTLFGSATGSRSAADAGAALRIGGGDKVLATAFQLGVARTGVVGRNDRLRLSVSQPLTVERGSIEFSQIAVIDRETGEKGVVTERFDIQAAPRRAVAELQYGTGLLGGRGEFSVFGRGELRKVAADTPAVMAGGQFRFAF